VAELGVVDALAVGVGFVGDAPGDAVDSRTGSHARLLPAIAELAALAWLATVARLNPETVVSRTPPASRVTATDRACAKRMKRLPVLIVAVRNDYFSRNTSLLDLRRHTGTTAVLPGWLC
jgi:hypothetical protein